MTYCTGTVSYTHLDVYKRQQNGCSLYDALRRNLDSELLRGTKGGKFVSLIESFTGIYEMCIRDSADIAHALGKFDLTRVDPRILTDRQLRCV